MLCCVFVSLISLALCMTLYVIEPAGAFILVYRVTFGLGELPLLVYIIRSILLTKYQLTLP